MLRTAPDATDGARQRALKRFLWFAKHSAAHDHSENVSPSGGNHLSTHPADPITAKLNSIGLHGRQIAGVLVVTLIVTPSLHPLSLLHTKNLRCSFHSFLFRGAHHRLELFFDLRWSLALHCLSPTAQQLGPSFSAQIPLLYIRKIDKRGGVCTQRNIRSTLTDWGIAGSRCMRGRWQRALLHTQPRRWCLMPTVTSRCLASWPASPSSHWHLEPMPASGPCGRRRTCWHTWTSTTTWWSKLSLTSAQAPGRPSI